jgi:transposase
MRTAKKKMGRPTKYKPEFCQRVIELASEGMGKAEIACGIGVSRDTIHEWTKVHQDFSDAIRRAYEEALAWWERKGREATFGGVPGFQSTAYIFQMKNRFKDDWRDKIDHDVEFTGDIHVKLGGNVDD